MENSNTFENKTGYFLEISTLETMKLLRSAINKTTKDENDECVPHLEINELALAHCNIVNNNCQQDSRILYIVVQNKSFSQLLHNLIKNFTFLKAFNSEFSYSEIWFTDHNYKAL